MYQDGFSRTELLIGKENLKILKDKKIAVIGIGGVGSFAVEALARCAIGQLILVDNDIVSISNLNRQIHATFKTISKNKVDVMAERVKDINPNCHVKAYNTYIKKENIEDILGSDLDYVIDAIDTVTSKLDLILYCKEKNINIISSMGTGNKLDPTKFKISDIYKTKICPLAKVMRHELRKRNVESLKVLYSDETPIKPNYEEALICEESFICSNPGSISFVPPVAGMIIAGEVIKDLINL
ncbi:MAG: tRNA threonylcarbamoyladenosine dehydratase [Oscillospiraceae bacterium]|nr:tRNA threonylcarbamoyladenosine dehydratase [Oscillospiraceae bacterium]